MVKGARLLKAHITKLGITRSAAAKQIGASAAAVQYWITGGQRPRSDIRQRIEKWSAGEVPAESWLKADEARALAEQTEAKTGIDAA